jgi:hypothetical protein
MNSENTIDFEKLYRYDTLKTGITLPVLLKLDSLETFVQAKIDTGASHSIFQRIHGEYLGLKIETGDSLSFSFNCYRQFSGIWARVINSIFRNRNSYKSIFR